MKQIVIVQDQLHDKIHLSFGYFEPGLEYSHTEIERAYNIYGEKLKLEKKHYTSFRILRMGEGIKSFKNHEEVQGFLSKMFPDRSNLKVDVFNSDLVHRKFEIDRDTLLPLSCQ